MNRLAIGAVVCGALAGGGCREPAAGPGTTVSSSYLACAIADLSSGAIPVECLSGPGGCPGHFDIRPSQVKAIRRSVAFFCFDFQKGLGERIRDMGGSQVTVVTVKSGHGFGVPETYLGICRDVAKHLAMVGLADRKQVENRLRKVEERMESLARDARAKIHVAGMRGQPVLASGHQAAFCRWLGFKVVGTFQGGDAMRIGEMDELVRNGRNARVRLIVGNVPEGRQVADALGAQLKAKVAMLENFPESRAAATGFDVMVRTNVERLVRSGS
ncbi:MAG: zinc ABC transporter substrate-binding protein [Lentisphaerae bacterium]|nr:zinc ABC transporter substrate-binding protein [Lentisphaerota bacterium]